MLHMIPRVSTSLIIAIYAKKFMMNYLPSYSRMLSECFIFFILNILSFYYYREEGSPTETIVNTFPVYRDFLKDNFIIDFA